MSLRICKSAAELDVVLNALRENGRSIGFVPTMGALHEGHLSLMRLAAEHADVVVVSIYVNPTQFAPHEDFDAYPRDIEADIAQLTDEPVDMVFLPEEADVYPDGAQVSVKAGSAAQGLETDFRPHFFDGVSTVVHRLFALVQPDVAVFGKKDFQQLQVIRQMVENADLPIKIVGGPIMRNENGLALSSRNAYLSEEQLEIAQMLNHLIYKAAADIAVGLPIGDVLATAEAGLLTCGFDKIDYVAFKPEWNRVLAAGWVGKTRLIDNCAVER